MAAFLRKYGTGTGADVYIPIPKRGVVDFAVSADWTPASGDVKVSKDGGAAANIGTLPTAVTMGNTAMWKFVFTDAELQCAYLAVTIADSATKAVEDQMFVIETYGNASALHAFDLDTATQSVNVSQISGDSTAADTLELFVEALDQSTGQIDSGSLAAGTITAASIAADAITDAKVASDVTIASVTGSVGSVTGAVGSVTGNVGGNVVGSVASVTAGVTLANGAITNASLAGNMEIVFETDFATNYSTVNDQWNVSTSAVASVTGAVGSVTGAVGSVTGNVGGNVLGSVGSVTGAVGSVAAGGITAASIATGAIDADALAADAVSEIQSGLSTLTAQQVWQFDLASVIYTDPTMAGSRVEATYGRADVLYVDWLDGGRLDAILDARASQTSVDTVSTNVSTLLTRITATLFSGITSLGQWLGAMAGKQTSNSTALTEINATGAGSGTFNGATDSLESIRDNASAPTAAQVADAVWDEAAADHNTSGTMGARLNAAGAASDPLDNAVPGSYAVGTAGYVLGQLEDREIAFESPVLADGTIDIVQNGDYYTADGRDLEWTFTRPYVPSSCILRIASGSTISITSTDITETSGSGSGRFSVRFQIPRTDGDDLDSGTGSFDVVSVLSNGHEVPEIAEGKATIRRRLTT